MTAKIKLNAASGGGSFSLQAPSSSANTRVMTLPDTADGTILTTTNPKSGNIIQVVTVIKSSEFTESIAAGAKTALVTGLTVSITPASTSNKILVMTSIATHNGLESACPYIILRDSTEIFLGNDDDALRASVTGIGLASSGMAFNISYTGLDSPSTTSSITYGVKLINPSSASTRTVRVNGGSTSRVSASSSITLMEVAG